MFTFGGRRPPQKAMRRFHSQRLFSSFSAPCLDVGQIHCLPVCGSCNGGSSVTVNPSTAAHADSQTLGKTEQINYLSGCFHKKKKKKESGSFRIPQLLNNREMNPPPGRQTQIFVLQLFIFRQPTASWRQFECTVDRNLCLVL